MYVYARARAQALASTRVQVGAVTRTYVRVDTRERERNTPHTWELLTYRVRVLRATRVSRVRVCQVGCELYCKNVHATSLS